MPKILMFIIFFTIVISIFFLMNFYFYRKLSFAINNFENKKLIKRILIYSIIILTTIFFINNFFNIESILSITNFIMYTWGAFLFQFLFYHSVFELLSLIIKLKFKISYKFKQYIFIIISLLCASLLVYGFFNAKNIEIKTLKIITNKLPKNTEKFRIMLISDVHFSPLVGIKMAQKIKSFAEKIRPDILLSAGDLVDKGISNPQKIIDVFKSINPKYGKYTVMGNHEFISGSSYSENFINQAGFTILRNSFTKINDILVLVGIDDPSVKRFENKELKDEKKLLSQIQSNKFVIFLKHQPVLDNNSINLFDLQLSGHTHAGQIFPFILLVKLFYSKTFGLYHLGNNKNLYISKGTGTWGPPFRIFARPEITIIELIREN